MKEDMISEYLEWLRTCSRSPRTIGARKDILGRADAALPEGLAAATTEELKRWIYRDEWSLATRETYYGAIRSFFVWASNPQDPRIDYDPSALLPRPVKPRGLPRPVTDEQLRRILTESIEPYRTWSLLAAYEGLRCCEIAQLDRSDIDERTVLIRRGKGGRPGVVPTHPMVWAAVKDLPPGPLATGDNGDRVGAKWVSIRTALYFRRQLGMPGVALHRLRHWFGTNTYRTTKDIRVTQELLRHSSPTTTAIYTLINDEERAAAIHALPTFTGQPS
ncbi:MAG TPA: tyrosine-type recombinase/integrase [Mycobacteriales bacterium]